MGSPHTRIGAKISGPSSDICGVSRRLMEMCGEACHLACRKSASEGCGMMACRSVATSCRRQAPSAGPCQAACAKRGESSNSSISGSSNKNDQEMSQHIRLGGAFVYSRRRLQADQAFEALEGEFDAPAQAIKGEHIVGGVTFGGSDVTRITQSAAVSVLSEIWLSFSLGCPARVAPEASAARGGFLTATRRRASAGPDLRPSQDWHDRSIVGPGRSFRKVGDKIEGLAIGRRASARFSSRPGRRYRRPRPSPPRCGRAACRRDRQGGSRP